MATDDKYSFLLNQDFSECERGNVLLTHTEEDMFNAWIQLDGDIRLEIAWRPQNYPSLTVQLVKCSDEELWQHLIKEFSTMWNISKLNLGEQHLTETLEEEWKHQETGDEESEEEEAASGG